ncbi:hypothetical protein SETIT_9G182700v2 [Setaria italica]|uniref:Uncharacterized protein n=2 Tax=Setaria italica TaxID=4555 RepID=A0A368SI50_SETIT|nr:hypothetical protein SETIT_9G182700v2 [Setaria italica]
MGQQSRNSKEYSSAGPAMGSKDDAPTWADQWGSGDDGSSNGKADDSKKTVAGNVKAAASEGFVKAKAAALVGASKVKSGTSSGIKWVKEQYQKRASK